MKFKQTHKIGLIGSESCGKSTLSQQLAEYYSGIYVPEYAREYVEQLTQPYTFSDVCNIAKRQIEQLTEIYQTNFIFFDTELIITKVWFLDKYNCVPDFLEEALKNNPIEFYLLLEPDLPFEQDPVRENPHRREELFLWYKQELEYYGFNYKTVDGIGDFRLKKAIDCINCRFL